MHTLFPWNKPQNPSVQASVPSADMYCIQHAHDHFDWNAFMGKMSHSPSLFARSGFWGRIYYREMWYKDLILKEMLLFVDVGNICLNQA